VRGLAQAVEVAEPRMVHAFSDDDHGIVGQPLSRPRFAADQTGIGLLDLVLLSEETYGNVEEASPHEAIIDELAMRSRVQALSTNW